MEVATRKIGESATSLLYNLAKFIYMYEHQTKTANNKQKKNVSEGVLLYPICAQNFSAI